MSLKSQPQQNNTVALSAAKIRAFRLHGFNVHLSTTQEKTRELFSSPLVHWYSIRAILCTLRLIDVAFQHEVHCSSFQKEIDVECNFFWECFKYFSFNFFLQLIKTEGLNLHTPRSTPQEDLYRQSAEVTTSVANGVVPSPNVCIEWLCREHLKITCLCTLNREHVKTFTSTLNRKHLKIDVLRIGIFSKLYVHLIENISKKNISK